MAMLVSTAKATAADCERDIAATSQTRPAHDFSGLIAALSGKVTDQSERIATLETALRMPPRSQAEMLLQDRARLYLAGAAIQQQKFDAARERLRLVSMESPLAADAGLLIAESWQLQGNTAESLQWLLRVGRRFADDITALQGLQDAAATLEEAGQYQQAATLYSEVVEKALQVAEKLENLPTDTVARTDAIVFQAGTMAPALRRQLTSEMIRQTPDVGRTRQVHRESLGEWKCLLLQQQQLEQNLESIRQHSVRLERISQLAAAALSELDNEIPHLEKKLISRDFSAEQLTLRKRLSQARNEKARLMAEQEFIAATRDTLPQALTATEEKLDTMVASFGEIQAQSALELHQAVALAVDAVSARFRNLAGQSQRRLAELQMQQTRQP